MTLDALVASLPWGLHDAYLEALSIDWPRASGSLSLRLMISEGQDQEKPLLKALETAGIRYHIGPVVK
jgi:hypothetical protein